MITTLEQLKQRAFKEVSLPGWDEEPFVCLVKRVGILELASEGKIPNSLLGAATTLFEGKKNDGKQADLGLPEMAKLINLIAESVLVEPSIGDLKSIGLNLTDAQKLALFQYSQEGLKALEGFRPERADNSDNKHE